MIHIDSPILLKNLVIGKNLTINPSIDEENNKKILHFDKDYWNKPMTITFENAYWDLNVLCTNNWRKMHGKNLLPYRKLFKLNHKYALTIYNKQRKYIRDRYTFEEWRKMKGIN